MRQRRNNLLFQEPKDSANTRPAVVALVEVVEVVAPPRLQIGHTPTLSHSLPRTKPPRNRRERDFNDAMAEKAEAVRCRRFEAIVNERYDFLDKNRLKGDFLEYFRRQLPKQNAKWEFVYLHFEKFV